MLVHLLCVAQESAPDLSRIITSIKQIENDVAAKQQILTSPQGAGKEDELQKQISELTAQQKSLEHSLEEIASGVNLDRFGDTKYHQKISWENEVQELIAPVLSQIKRATSRPREMEKLRTELSDSEELISLSVTALKNLAQLKLSSKNLSDLEQVISKL